MLQNAQKGMAKWTVRILLALLILSFAMWGIADYATGPVNPPVAFVGDREIRGDTFLNAAQRQISEVRRQTNQVIDTRAAIERGIYAQTMSELINRNILLQQAENWSLGVSEDMTADEIRRDPVFQTANGTFDRTRFDTIIRNVGHSEQSFIAATREDMLNRQIESSITAGLDRGHVPVARAIMAYNQEIRVLTLVEFPNPRLADAAEPAESEITAFHQENKDQFSTPERRSARIVYLRPQDLTGDMVIDEQPIEGAYQENLEAYTTPGRREVRQAIFVDEAAAQAARQRIDQGASFETVVQEATSGPPIDLGEVTEGNLPGAVGDAAFAAAADTIVGPVQSSFGWHLIEVGAVTERVVQPLSEVREEIIAELKLEEAQVLLVDYANRIEDELAGGNRASDVAAAIDVAAHELAPVDRNGLLADGSNALEILPPQVLRQLFNQEPDQDLEAEELADGSILLVELVTIQEPQLRPLAEVRDDVVAAMKAQDLGERAAVERDKLLDKAKAGTSLQALADEFGGSLRTTEGITRRTGEPAFSGPAREAAFALSQGELGGGADFGGASQFIFRIDQVTVPELKSDDPSVASLAQVFGQTFQEDIRLQYIIALREEIGFDVHETNFRQAIDPNGLYFGN